MGLCFLLDGERVEREKGLADMCERSAEPGYL